MCYLTYEAKVVDCETYRFPDGTLLGKGSTFCSTLSNEHNKTISSKTKGCFFGSKKDLDDMKLLFGKDETFIWEDGCYDSTVEKFELCLCSTDECNSGIHKQNRIVQL